MRTAGSSIRVPDHYMDLVEAFPLRSIKSKALHKAAVGVLSKLAIEGRIDEGSTQYMETLGQLIDDYEREAGLKLKMAGVGPVQIIRHFMAEHSLNVTELGKIVGSQGTLSDVLAGRRELSKAMIRKLADHFAVSPALFF